MVDNVNPLYEILRSIRKDISTKSAEFIPDIEKIIKTDTEDAKLHTCGIFPYRVLPLNAQGVVRMFLVLAIYYDYFDTGSPCEFVSTNLPKLAQVLSISPSELRAYEFLVHGPVDIDPAVDPLLYWFSKQIRQTNNDRSFSRNPCNM